MQSRDIVVGNHWVGLSLTRRLFIKANSNGQTIQAFIW